ncbi:DNA topology modulation protein [Enterococcus ureasiticus]|uniref:AAA family ATPase n=1 Tax=Enterococcus ureasiticus TaxID=903984 RepID=A0A1E5GDR7_9ENTE|nr:DNA topology modulation protein [Enterococcus ureasiticus]OEG10848.1 AAA family ATPase [Enterococcus ureasiticus]
MKKIILIGSSGAGKSTLSLKIGEKLDIEVFHLDKLLWKPNWEMTDREYQNEIQNNLIMKPSWIIDGNYGGTLDIRMKSADTIIFLDRNRFVCIYQILKRVKKYNGITRPDMQNNCPEKFDFSFIKWVWNFPNKQRIDILRMLKNIPKTKKVIVLKNKKQIQLFLDEL